MRFTKETGTDLILHSLIQIDKKASQTHDAGNKIQQLWIFFLFTHVGVNCTGPSINLPTASYATVMSVRDDPTIAAFIDTPRPAPAPRASPAGRRTPDTTAPCSGEDR
jgi:hypothetical protein